MSDKFNVRALNFQISSPTFLKQYFGYDIIVFSSISIYMNYLCVLLLSRFSFELGIGLYIFRDPGTFTGFPLNFTFQNTIASMKADVIHFFSSFLRHFYLFLVLQCILYTQIAHHVVHR